MEVQPTRARSTRSVAAPRPVSMAFSSVGHDCSSTNNQGDPNSSRRSVVLVEVRTTAPELDAEFAYPDGNIELQASSHIFWVHEFQLAKFAKVTDLIRQARERGDLTSAPERRVKVNIPCTGKLSSKDVRQTLRVIYSSFVSGHTPPTFDGATLVSTLRVATLYQNPDLRNFSITQLQSRFVLSPIYRIALSDELSIPDWEAPAFLELCRRPEALSQKEATVLGITRTVEVARVREAEQRHQCLALIHQATADPFLSSEGNIKKDKLKAAAEQTLKNHPLPMCNCRTQNDDTQNDPSLNRRSWFGATEVDYSRRNSSFVGALSLAQFGGSVDTCQIHQLAPPIASESRALHKHLSSTLERLATLKRTLSTKMRGLPGGDKYYSVENEIQQASWPLTGDHDGMDGSYTQNQGHHSISDTPLWMRVPLPAPQGESIISPDANTTDSLTYLVHPDFSFPDGNIELQTPDCTLWIHEFQLKQFKVLAKRIEEARKQTTTSGVDPNYRTKVKVPGESVDFINTFRIIYASIIPGVGSPQLGLTTFVSALRIATLYEHPQLREFAISKLQDSRLPAIQRIQLADELSIPEWESIALSELSRRPESIARDEAEILGMARIVTISHKRDKKQRSQLHNLELIEYFKMIFTPDFFIFMMLIGLFCAVMSFIVELVSACFGQAGSVVRILGRVLNMIITVEY